MLSKKNILVTGSNGQLGMECKVLMNENPIYNMLCLDREELNIENKKDIEEYFQLNKIDVCINAAAYTAVDLAEKEIDKANLVNGEAVGNLAAVCHQFGAKFIHVSTDYVFNGEKQEGYDETDETGPINVYGESKLLGEKMAMANNANSIIIRTSWVYSSFGKNFVKTMMKLMSERESINVVCDQTGRPTYAKNLAIAIFKLIEQAAPGGIYHYADEGAINWFEFASEIKKICNYQCNINPIPSSEYPVPAKRPRYSILNTQKISTIQGVVVPHWKEGLQDCINLLRKS